MGPHLFLTDFPGAQKYSPSNPSFVKLSKSAPGQRKSERLYLLWRLQVIKSLIIDLRSTFNLNTRLILFLVLT